MDRIKTINCSEAGFDCDYIVRDQTEEEVMKNGAEYAMKDHGMKEEDITSEMKQKIRPQFLLSSTLVSYNIIALLSPSIHPSINE